MKVLQTLEVRAVLRVRALHQSALLREKNEEVKDKEPFPGGSLLNRPGFSLRQLLMLS